MSVKKKKKRVRLMKVTPNVAVSPDNIPVHEIVHYVESIDPPPADVLEEISQTEFREPIAATKKKRGFWAWLLG